MLHQKVLMVALGRIEARQRRDLRHDWRAEHAGGIELMDVGVGNLRLRRVRREQLRAVLRADIGALTVELGRVVSRPKNRSAGACRS